MLKEHVFEGRIKEFEEVFINYLKNIGIAKNTSPNIQLIISYLAIHKSLTQKQLRDLTGLSAGTISKNLKKIMEFGDVVKKERSAGRYEYIYTMEISKLIRRVSNIYSDEFVDLINFLREKLKELESHKGKRGQKILSERINDLIYAMQTINDISQEIAEMFMVKN